MRAGVESGLGHEHGLVADHLHDTPATRGDGVVGDLLETGHHRRQLLLGELLAEHGEPHHVGEAHGQHGEGAAVAPGAQQHGPAHRGLDVTPPHELEQPGHGGERVVRPAGRSGRPPPRCPPRPVPSRHAPRDAGDTSASAMRAIDDPMTRANWRLVLDVGHAEVHHRPEDHERLDVEVGEHALVGLHVGEAQGPPEAPGELEVHARHLRHLGLGVAALGRDEEPVGHEQVEHVAAPRPRRSRPRGCRGPQEGAHPLERRRPVTPTLSSGVIDLRGRRTRAWPSAT